MGMMDSINGFVDTMIDEQSQFETMQNEITRREQDVAAVLDELEKKERAVIQKLQERSRQGHDVYSRF